MRPRRVLVHFCLTNLDKQMCQSLSLSHVSHSSKYLLDLALLLCLMHQRDHIMRVCDRDLGKTHAEETASTFPLLVLLLNDLQFVSTLSTIYLLSHNIGSGSGSQALAGGSKTSGKDFLGGWKV